MKISYLLTAAAALGVSSTAMAASFTNGGFEDGNTNGWTVVSSKYRNGTLNNALTPTFVKTNPTGPAHSAVIDTSYVDPLLGAKLGSTVNDGKYAYRVEDTTTGGYASLIEQRVNNYTDAGIFFAWKSVLEGAHDATEAATMIITLTDLTTNTVLVTRNYNAASGGSGIDPRFTYDSPTNLYYTKTWQLESFDVSALQGHDFLLSVIASDCEPTGHRGYVYLDGFGNVAPPNTGGVPEPATWAMMIGGFGMVGASMRYRRRKTTVSFA
ncbi:MAG: PEPxxWA-CTERM sorting domain-containing protein [Pseudomonadota bacterium]